MNVSSILCVLGAAVAVVFATRAREFGAAPIQQTVASTPAPDPDDPALLRLALLHRLDARIDEAATKSHLDVRIALDEVYPLPYLGVDGEATKGGVVLTAVYADMGADRAGLKQGDVLRTFAGVPLDSKSALARNVRRHHVGDVIELQVERAGTPLTVRATLGRRPEEDEDEEEQFPDLVVLKPVPSARTLHFDDAEIGALPAALESVLGGHGRAGAWRIAAGEQGRLLRQEDDDATGIRFPMAVVREWEASDAVIRVRFRYAGGRLDRAAGIVLRWRDPGNYYVARANALEGDLRIFRVVNGDRRTLLGATAKGSTDDERWHTLEFRAEGAKLTATLDGHVRAEAFDSFFLRGRAGVWTKSDSRTEFDELQMEATR